MQIAWGVCGTAAADVTATAATVVVATAADGGDTTMFCCFSCWAMFNSTSVSMLLRLTPCKIFCAASDVKLKLKSVRLGNVKISFEPGVVVVRPDDAAATVDTLKRRSIGTLSIVECFDECFIIISDPQVVVVADDVADDDADEAVRFCLR